MFNIFMVKTYKVGKKCYPELFIYIISVTIVINALKYICYLIIYLTNLNGIIY